MHFSLFMYDYLRQPHVVNNCIKRHINIPTYSTSQETVLQNQFVDGMPMYQQPVYGQLPMQNPMYGQMMQGNMGGCGCNQCNQMMQPNNVQYQGNVGTEPMMQQPLMYPNMNAPYNY